MRSSMKPALYQDLFLRMLIFLQKCISNHETKQSSQVSERTEPQLLYNQRLKYKLLFQTLTVKQLELGSL